MHHALRNSLDKHQDVSKIILDNKIKVMIGTYVFPDAKYIKQESRENK